MASFVINAQPIYRAFTVNESSAISMIEIEGDYVEISFQSNTEKAYIFNSDKQFARHLSNIISSPDLLGLSLGSVISKARKSGELKEIENYQFA